MSFCFQLCSTFVILLIYISVVELKKVKEHFTTSNNWQFVTRFCFLSNNGILKFNISYLTSQPPLTLLLYYDQPGVWDTVYGTNNLVCTQKEEILNKKYMQIIDLNPFESKSWCDVLSDNQTISCTSPMLQVSTSRPRWWFLVLSSCNSTIGITADLNIAMLNTQSRSFFYMQFSGDEIGILPTNIAFLLAELVIFCVAIYFAVELTKRNLCHTTYEMFLFEISARVVYLLIECAAYTDYGINGVLSMGAKYLGEAVQAISHIVFVFMLILLAFGYTVVCGRFKLAIKIGFCVYVIIFSIAYCALFLVEALTFDPGVVLYEYESPAGYALIGILIYSWLLFLCAGIVTMRAHKKKRKFYILLLVFYGYWFWAVPIMVLIALTQIDAWVRQQIVNGINCAIFFVGDLVFLVITRPTISNVNFPFHIETNQIDVITYEEAKERAENGEDDFIPESQRDFSQLDRIFTVPDYKDVMQNEKRDIVNGYDQHKLPPPQEQFNNQPTDQSTSFPQTLNGSSLNNSSVYVRPSSDNEELRTEFQGFNDIQQRDLNSRLSGENTVNNNYFPSSKSPFNIDTLFGV